MATASFDADVKLWDLRTGDPSGQVCDRHFTQSLQRTFSPDPLAIVRGLSEVPLPTQFGQECWNICAQRAYVARLSVPGYLAHSGRSVIGIFGRRRQCARGVG